MGTVFQKVPNIKELEKTVLAIAASIAVPSCLQVMSHRTNCIAASRCDIPVAPTMFRYASFGE
jgi:hypothetical protein